RAGESRPGRGRPGGDAGGAATDGRRDRAPVGRDGGCLRRRTPGRGAAGSAALSIQSHNERGGAIAGLFVRRPVLAIVVSALIIVAGLAAFFGVEIRELPSVERPTLSISTTFSGASAETVDREITSAIEGAVARVQGVASISSSSSYGRSRVSLTFTDGTNLDNATSDLRDALSRIVNRLPEGADDPTIIKADSDAQAIIQLAVTSDTLSKDELTALVNDVIEPRFAAVSGVADV